MGQGIQNAFMGAWPDIVFLPVTSVQSNLQFPSDLLGASLCQMRPVDISDSSRASRYEVGPGLTQACREYNIKPHKCVWTRTDYRPLADHRCATVDLLGDIRLDLRNAIRAVGPGKAITALGKAPRWHLCCNQLAAFWSTGLSTAECFVLLGARGHDECRQPLLSEAKSPPSAAVEKSRGSTKGKRRQQGTSNFPFESILYLGIPHDSV